MTQYQSSEIGDQLVLILGTVIAQILLQLSKELPLPSLLILKTKTDQSRYRLAHAYINCLGVVFDLMGKRRS